MMVFDDPIAITFGEVNASVFLFFPHSILIDDFDQKVSNLYCFSKPHPIIDTTKKVLRKVRDTQFARIT